ACEGGRYANSARRRRVRKLSSRCQVCWIASAPNTGRGRHALSCPQTYASGTAGAWGSENPAVEAQMDQQLHNEQEDWIRKERESECHVLKNASQTLKDSGFDTQRVTLKFGYEDDIARNILEEARGHETIVVGRHGTSRIKRLFGGGVTDQLLR